MLATVKCVTFLSKKLSRFYDFSRNSQSFIFYNHIYFVLSDAIETLKFENEVFGLAALITNVNFRWSLQYLGHDIFSLEKSIFLKWQLKKNSKGLQFLQNLIFRYWPKNQVNHITFPSCVFLKCFLLKQENYWFYWLHFLKMDFK